MGSGHCTEQRLESTTDEGAPMAEGLPEEAEGLPEEAKGIGDRRKTTQNCPQLTRVPGVSRQNVNRRFQPIKLEG